MTDLTKMSVNDLEKCAVCNLTATEKPSCHDAMKEMARRLREQEQEYAAYREETCITIHDITTDCQAREGELRGALDNLVASIIPMHKTFKHGNESTYFLAEQAQKLLSHSTGSKLF